MVADVTDLKVGFKQFVIDVDDHYALCSNESFRVENYREERFTSPIQRADLVDACYRNSSMCVVQSIF